MSKEGVEGRTAQARTNSNPNHKWPQPSMIMRAASRKNKYIGYSKIGTPQVMESRSKARPPQKDSTGSEKTRTGTGLCCCWPWCGIGRGNRTSSAEGDSFLWITAYLGRRSGAPAAAATTREAALQKTRELIGRRCLRHLETENVRQHDARDPQDGASTSYLNNPKKNTTLEIDFLRETLGSKFKILTIVALGDAILYSSALGEIRYLGPIFVRVGAASELGCRRARYPGTGCPGVVVGS